jgi:hypothetical protein
MFICKGMRMRARKIGPVLVLAMACTEEARATPTFPDVVQSHYGLSAKPVDPPQGCMLCHVDDVGGAPTTLRPFGRHLFNEYRVVAYDDASLRAALTLLDSQEPGLAAVIKSGGDPNNGPAGGGATTDGGVAIASDGITDPVPGYGCMMCAPRNARGIPWAIGSLGGAWMLRRRRRR